MKSNRYNYFVIFGYLGTIVSLKIILLNEISLFSSIFLIISLMTLAFCGFGKNSHNQYLRSKNLFTKYGLEFEKRKGKSSAFCNQAGHKAARKDYKINIKRARSKY